MQTKTGPTDYFKIALLAAILTHGLFLAFMPGVKVQVDEITKNLNFTLITRKEIPQRKSLEPRSEPVNTMPLEQADIVSVAKQEARQSDQTSPVAAMINHQTIRAWARTQNQQHLSSQPGAVDEFNKTFEEPTPKVVDKIQTYINPYGEQHFVTQLNGKDVCYMQGVPVVSDEWSADVVMFYDCRKQNKFEINRR